jgi:hypothetical protein
MTDNDKVDTEVDFSTHIHSNTIRTSSPNPNFYEYEETFQKLPLGLVMSHKKNSAALCVTGFLNIAASRDGRILVGDELVCVNGISLEDMKSKAILKVINSSSCPLTILFRRPIVNHLIHDLDYELPRKTRISSNSPHDVSNATIENIQTNASAISSMIADINNMTIKMKDVTGVGNDAIRNINFGKLSSFRDASAGLGYRLDIALEKLEMLERKYLSPVNIDRSASSVSNPES